MQKSRSQEITPVLIVFVLLSCFYLLRLCHPFITQFLYSSEQFTILNKLIGAYVNSGLDFYIGRMEDVFWGPLSIFLANIALLVAVLKYYRDRNAKKFFFLILAYLLLTKFEVIFYPPYGDSVSGPFAEGMWLYNNSFDYAGLAEQPNFLAGGPKVYLFSIYPTYLALMMKFIPNAKAFLFFNHFIVFVLSAAIIALFREIIRRVYPQVIANLSAVLLLSLPLFQSQSEQINMEMPVLFFSTAAIYYLSNKQLFQSVILAILAVLTKGVAIVFCLSVFMVCLILFLFDRELRLKFRTIIWGIVALIFSIFFWYCSFFILNKGGKAAMVGLWAGWEEMRKSLPIYLYTLSLFYFVGMAIFNKLKSSSYDLATFIESNYVALIMFISAGGWFVLYLNSAGLQNRYWLLVLPFLLFIFVYIGMSFLKLLNIAKIVLILLIGMYSLGSYGFPKAPHLQNAHSAQERSLEYRNDLRMNMKLAKEIEENYFDYIISAPLTFAQALAFNKIGYVSKKLDVMIYQFPCQYEGIRNFTGLKDIDRNKTLWVSFNTNLSPKMSKIVGDYPVGKNDIVLKRIEVGNRFGTLFLGGEAIEKVRLINMLILKQMLSRNN